jgi:multimeric flavodoxin WrbA
MKSLLIVHHSRTGGARQMAEAAARGAGADGEVAVRRVAAALGGPSDLLDAEGYIFACPENLAAISGVMKDFFDRCYYPVLDRIQGRPYALIVSAGSDGTNVVRQVGRIAAGWRLKAVAEPIIVITRAQTAETILAAKTIAHEDLERCETLGATFAAGLAMGLF